MTTTENTTTQPQLIAVAKLEKSPSNARRTVRPDGLGELKASILSHGLMQNLVVTPSGDGKYLVIAGGRRLEALRTLQAEGKLPEDFSVPCQIVTEAHALEMSLAENTVRLAMHPADQFAVFAELIDQGQTASQVAERLGVEESLVLKRMKLARVAPDLLQAYRNDEITLECLMAFTITDDHQRQLKLYKSLQHWQKDDPGAIRDALTEKMVDAGSNLARFVGLDAYTAAGGTSRRDLFSEEIYLEKPALLNRLAEKKLDAIRQELEAEGWGWIEINPERDWTLINRCTRIKPSLSDAPAELLDAKEQLDCEWQAIEQALDEEASDELLEQQQALRGRLDEVEEQLAAFVGFDPEHKALAGCFVSIGQDGIAFIDKGLVRPEQRKQLARLLNTDTGDDESLKVKPKGHLPESLRRDLAEYRLEAAQAELARHPALALDLLIFDVASEVLDTPSAGDGPDVQFRHHAAKPTRLTGSTAAGDALQGIRQSLPADWLRPESETARFEAFRSLPDASKLDLLAYCVALTLKPKLAPASPAEVTAYDAALAMTGADVAGYWRPTKDNFLGRVTREQLLGIGREVLGETWSQARYSDKKSALADQLDRAFTDPDKGGRTPEQVQKLKTWLPAGMAFGAVPMTKPAKARKAKKAA